MTEYGQKIVWHNFRGDEFIAHSSGTDKAEVKTNVLKVAIRMGWTPPKWWQFWRWRDTRIEA